MTGGCLPGGECKGKSESNEEGPAAAPGLIVVQCPTHPSTAFTRRTLEEAIDDWTAWEAEKLHVHLVAIGRFEEITTDPTIPGQDQERRVRK